MLDGRFIRSVPLLDPGPNVPLAPPPGVKDMPLLLCDAVPAVPLPPRDGGAPLLPRLVSGNREPGLTPPPVQSPLRRSIAEPQPPRPAVFVPLDDSLRTAVAPPCRRPLHRSLRAERAVRAAAAAAGVGELGRRFAIRWKSDGNRCGREISAGTSRPN